RLPALRPFRGALAALTAVRALLLSGRPFVVLGLEEAGRVQQTAGAKGVGVQERELLRAEREGLVDVEQIVVEVAGEEAEVQELVRRFRLLGSEEQGRLERGVGAGSP